jgi:hypothetical protein
MIIFVSRCADGKCPSRKDCVRAHQKACESFAYADFNRKDGDDKCEDFLDNRQIKYNTKTP